MIVLDPHIWIWWVQGDAKLPAAIRQAILQNERSGLGVCAISLWEVAMLVEHKKIDLRRDTNEWLSTALGYPGVELLELTPAVAVESCSLPPPFHRDPADRLIVATARLQKCPLATCDRPILAYPHVETV